MSSLVLKQKSMLLQYFILFDYPQMSNLICDKSILKGKFNLNPLKTKSMIHVPPNFFFVRARVAFYQISATDMLTELQQIDLNRRWISLCWIWRLYKINITRFSYFISAELPTIQLKYFYNLQYFDTKHRHTYQQNCFTWFSFNGALNLIILYSLNGFTVLYHFEF